MPIKSVAVIGTGPSGAIAVDALVREQAFDVIRVFERQEKAGGCWYANHPLRHQERDRIDV
jgi:cation diffusion facilitator CzcD-associated flavoprotein CzcO